MTPGDILIYLDDERIDEGVVEMTNSLTEGPLWTIDGVVVEPAGPLVCIEGPDLKLMWRFKRCD